MIAQLSGRLVLKKPNLIVVDVHGVGYEVHIPLSSFYPLPDTGNDVSLQTYTHVREDTLSLFGFLTERERLMFTRLIGIAGIGPKLAITILSGIPLEDFVVAVQKGDLFKLTTIPGVGKKTAERILLELKDKVADIAVAAGATEILPRTVQDDVISALMNLGYQRTNAEKAVKTIFEDGAAESSFEVILKASLKKLSGEKGPR
ncbi:MAG: Holliday junction branch migration protein RuvA [Acidobacteria bacterium]|nr:Holliday junction branch migration protein RuvA [Acidobacteriota bacterium]